MRISPVFNVDLLGFISRSGENGVTKEEIKSAHVSQDYALDRDLQTLISMNEIKLDTDKKYRLTRFV